MIWESLVFSRLRKKEINFNQGRKLWFFRDNLGLEVDFLVENAGKLDLIECKWTESPDKKSIQPMVRLDSKLGNITRLGVACTAPSSFPIEKAKAFNGLFDQFLFS